MEQSKFISIANRFLKGFVAGGYSSMLAQLAMGVTITSTLDLKKFAYSLVVAFLTGGLLAIEKLWNWTPAEPLPISPLAGRKRKSREV